MYPGWTIEPGYYWCQWNNYKNKNESIKTIIIFVFITITGNLNEWQLVIVYGQLDDEPVNQSSLSFNHERQIFPLEHVHKVWFPLNLLNSHHFSSLILFYFWKQDLWLRNFSVSVDLSYKQANRILIWIVGCILHYC